MPDEAHGAVREPARGGDGHHLVRGVAPVRGLGHAGAAACSVTCVAHPGEEALAVAADLVPGNVERIVPVVVALRVRRVRAAGRHATARDHPRRQDDGAGTRFELRDDLLDRDQRPVGGEHGLLLHAADPPQLHVARRVGLLRVDHGHVRAERRHAASLLAGERRT